VILKCVANGTAGLHLNTDPPSRPTFVRVGLEDVNAPAHTHAGTVTCGSGSSTPPPPPAGDQCTVESVISGDTFTCTDDRTVRMLQIDAPEIGACGGAWAKAALQYIFLTPGRVVTLQTDTKRTNSDEEVLAAPLWTGFDGATYNLRS
jgi:endonuclease YncB( thermonuclease family)